MRYPELECVQNSKRDSSNFMKMNTHLGFDALSQDFQRPPTQNTPLGQHELAKSLERCLLSKAENRLPPLLPMAPCAPPAYLTLSAFPTFAPLLPPTLPRNLANKLSLWMLHILMTALWPLVTPLKCSTTKPMLIIFVPKAGLFTFTLLSLHIQVVFLNLSALCCIPTVASPIHKLIRYFTPFNVTLVPIILNSLILASSFSDNNYFPPFPLALANPLTFDIGVYW